VADVVVRLSDEEARALVTTRRLGSRGHYNRRRARDKLRAALGSPLVEAEQEIVRVEIQYRVRGTERRTGCVWIGETRAKRPTAEHMSGVRDRNRGVRVENRTVSTLADGSSLTSPWVDLASEEGER
jgi:hypothetical protein